MHGERSSKIGRSVVGNAQKGLPDVFFRQTCTASRNTSCKNLATYFEVSPEKLMKDLHIASF